MTVEKTLQVEGKRTDNQEDVARLQSTSVQTILQQSHGGEMGVPASHAHAETETDTGQVVLSPRPSR